MTSKKEGVFLICHEKPELLAVEPVFFPKRRKGTDEEDLMAQNIAIKKLMTKAKQEHYPYFYQQGAIIPLKELKGGHCLRASHVFLPLEKKCKGVLSLTKPPGLYARYYFTGRYTGSGSAYQLLFSELERMGFSAVSGSYEYCILDSLASQNTDHYVTLIEMEVKKKG